MKPKTIRIFLPEGDPKASKVAEISNELGKVLFCSRKNIDFLRKREERDFTGVYFLFSQNQAYIGEAEKLFDRLKIHLQDPEKEWFSSIVFFTTKDNSFNKALIKYFESYCIDKAQEANRFPLMNRKSSNKSNISEYDEADIESYFENVKLLLTTIGFPLFEKLSEGTKRYYYNLKGHKAIGEFTNEGFIIKKGSKFELGYRPSANKSVKNNREKLIMEGVIKKIESHYEFVNDYLFSSPSMAGTIIAGGHVNGWRIWKTKDGKTLDEVERKNE